MLVGIVKGQWKTSVYAWGYESKLWFQGYTTKSITTAAFYWSVSFLISGENGDLVSPNKL